MILSGRDIKYYVETGLIKINPVEKSQYQQNGIDLIISKIIDKTMIDTNDTISQTYTLFPLRFYLGATKEILELPNNVMGFVELRSTWARRGLMIAPTIIDAGFKGNLTVEIFSAGYEGPAPINERFLHVVFSLLTTPGDPYKGKYLNQSGVTGPIE